MIADFVIESATMKGLPLYRHLRESLKKLYPAEPTGNLARHLNTLTSFVYGIIQSHRVNLPAIAGQLPNVGKEQSRIVQLKRWLSNDNIKTEVYFLPFIELLLQSLVSQTLVLVIDGSTVGRGCVTLMISVVYKGRALPLLWLVREGKKGHFPESMHIELIRSVQKLIPSGSDVVVLGDGEFDGTDWLSTISGFGWKYVCRTAKDSVFYEQGERFKIRDVCPARGDCTGIEAVHFTERQFGPVTAVAWWGKDYKEPLYLVSNFSTGGEACHWYGKRFRIETLFSDHKSRGFNLHKSHLSDPTRISRLMIATSLAYIWLVYLGEYALEQSWHLLIDRTERRDLSLFQLGARLLNRLLREGYRLPKFCLAMPGNALNE